jgi:Cys-tRNA(Pro)/Cys-tRNA(Cys) deacylase
VTKKSHGPGPTRATTALTKADIEFTVLQYEHDRTADSYGLEAAYALSLPPASVFKTLVADVDGDLVVGLVPVDRRLRLKALAAAVGGRKAVLAAEDRAERATGYVLGGISPIGMKHHLPTVIDVSATELEQIHVSGGRRGLEVALAPSDLVAYLKARVAPIARPE